MIPEIWTKQVYSHEGKYFNVPEREVIPKPFPETHPPLWSACSQDDTFQLAGEMGLGCLCNVLGQYETVERGKGTIKKRSSRPARWASLLTIR